MRVKRFLSKRLNIIFFVTIIFVLIGLLLGIVVPNTLFNNQIDAIEEDLHNLAIDYKNVTEVDSTQILYVYEDGESTMLTSSGYIDVIDVDVENHLIHWSHEQIVKKIQSVLYVDDFQEKHYIYYVYVVDADTYVVSYEDTKEVIMFVDSFRTTSLVAVSIFYLVSLLFSSTIVSSSLIKQYSLFDPVTNLHTKISLLNKYSTRSLMNYRVIYFNIYNLDNIIEAFGERNNEEILKMLSFNLSNSYQDKVFQLSQREYILILEEDDKYISFQDVINLKGYKFNELSTYELKSKKITIEQSLLEENDIASLIKYFTFAFTKIKSKKQSSFEIDKKLLDEIENERYYQIHLGNAIKNGDIVNFYQPKVNPENNTLIGAEALSRWIHKGKIISPANYIHLAEANGMIYDIDMISFQNALRFLKELEEKGLLQDDFKISTNFSPLSLKNISSEQIKKIITDSEVNPKHISFEITESVMLEFEVIEKLLRNLIDFGVSIEIDDFSAGNSSFAVLSVLNANVVKLDRAILPDKDDDEREKFIYNSLVDISKKLGLKIISEGVETDIQKAFVRDLGVEGVQGYFYSRPLSNVDFLNYVKGKV